MAKKYIVETEHRLKQVVLEDKSAAGKAKATLNSLKTGNEEYHRAVFRDNEIHVKKTNSLYSSLVETQLRQRGTLLKGIEASNKLWINAEKVKNHILEVSNKDYNDLMLSNNKVAADRWVAINKAAADKIRAHNMNLGMSSGGAATASTARPGASSVQPKLNLGASKVHTATVDKMVIENERLKASIEQVTRSNMRLGQSYGEVATASTARAGASSTQAKLNLGGARPTISADDYKRITATLTQATTAGNAFGKSMGGANTYAQTFFGTLKRASITVPAFYGMATAVMAVHGVLASAVTEVARFDQAINDNMAILQKSRVEAEYLAKSVTEVGVRFGTTTTDIQEGMITFGRAGVDNTEQLKKGTEGLAALSVITGDAMKYGAEAMSSMITVYPELAGNMGDLSNKMGAVANATKLGLQDFSTISNYALTTAANIGLTSDSYLILQGSMSKVGTSASSIGTSIARLGKIVSDDSEGSVNFFDTMNISQEQLAKAIHNDSETALVEFTRRLGIAVQDTDKWRDSTSGLDIQVKKTLNTLALIGKNNVYTEMQDKVNNAKDVTLQADLAAKGLQRTWESLKNTFKASIDELTVGAVSSLDKFIPSPEALEAFLKPTLAGLTAVLSLVDEVAVAFTSWFVITKVTKLIGGLSLAMNTLYGATGKSVLSMRLLSGVSKVFTPMNAALLGIVAIYEIWNFRAQQATDRQDALKKAVSLTTEELRKQTQEQRDTAILDILKGQTDLRLQSLEAMREYRSVKRSGDEEEITRSKAIYDGIVQQINENNNKLSVIQGINKEHEKEKANIDNTNTSGVNLNRTTQEIALATAQAAKSAYDMANAFDLAVLSFNKAMVGFSVSTGGMTSTLGEAKQFSLDMVQNQKEMVDVETRLGQVSALRYKEAKDDKKNQEEIIALTNKKTTLETQALTLTEGHLKSIHDSKIKAIEDETRASKAASTLRSSHKNLDPRAYGVEEKRLAAEIAQADLIAIDKKIKAADTIVERKDFELQKTELIATAEAKLTAEKMAQVKAGASAAKEREAAARKGDRQGAADKRAELKLISDELSLLGKKAELKMAIFENDFARQGLVASEYTTNIALTSLYESQALEARDAYDVALKKYGLLNKEATIQKTLYDLQIKAINADTKARKQKNKELTKFQKDMQGVGGSLADSFADGNFASGFKSLLGDVKDIFLKPLKDSFSELFGNAMNDLLSPLISGLTTFLGQYVSKTIAANASVAVATQATNATTGAAAVGPSVAVAGAQGGVPGATIMLALLAAVGMVGMVSGGGSTAVAPEKVEDFHVLSDSLENALDKIYDVQYPMLALTRDMRGYLEVIAGSFGDIENNILGSGVDFGGSSVKPTIASGTAWWGADETSLESTSLSFDATTVGGMMAGDLEAYRTDVIKTVEDGVFWDDTSYRSNMANVSTLFNDALADATVALFDSTKKLADTAGIDINNLLGESINIGKFDTTGMNSTAIAEEIERRYSAEVDRIFGDVFYDFEQFRVGGEGISETVIRVITDMEQVTHGLSLIGIELHETVGATDATTTKIYELTEAMIKGAGGIDALNASLSSYEQNFFTEQEQYQMQVVNMDKNFTALGLKMPETNEGFRQLIEGIDVTTEAGAKLFGETIGLAEGFNEMTVAGKALAQAQQEAIDASTANIKTWKDSFKSAKELAADMGRGLNKSLANTVEELDALFNQLTDRGMGFSDEELAFLQANKALIEANQEALNELSRAADTARDDAAKAEQTLANERTKIMQDMIKNVSDAWMGNLSYLTLKQKAEYASGYLALASGSNGAVSSVDAARVAAETALRSSATREQYIPAFERYIAELEKQAPEATLDDVVGRLDSLIEQVKDLESITRMTA